MKIIRKYILSICPFFIAFALSIFVLSACAAKPGSAVPSSLEEIPLSNENTHVAVMDGDRFYDPQSLEEEEKYADYVVKGVLLNDAKQKLRSFDSKFVYWGVTVSTLKITWVYRGNLTIGDRIPIAESYYTLRQNGETTRYELAYAPSTPGQEYIFFLGKEDGDFLRGFYVPVMGEKGRYRVQDIGFLPEIDFLSKKDLNLTVSEANVYKSIYKQVMNQYIR